jgi:transketolase
VDGHDPLAVAEAIKAAKADARPSIIRCKTTIGYGAPNKAGTSGSHGSPLGDEEIKATREALGWTAPPFTVPNEILSNWRAAGERCAADFNAWKERLEASDRKMEFLAQVDGVVNVALDARVHELKTAMRESGKGPATRASSQDVLKVLVDAVPWMLGGSADLTGSNNTDTPSMAPITAENPGGRYM